MSSPPSSPLFPPSPSESGSLDIDWPDDSHAEAQKGKEIKFQRAAPIVAKRYAPAHLAGLSYHPRFFSPPASQIDCSIDEQDEDGSDFVTRLLDEIARCGYFCKERGRDQAVLFLGRDGGSTMAKTGAGSGGPQWLDTLLEYIRAKLDASVEGYDLVFPPDNQGDSDREMGQAMGNNRSRQVILNLYEPGQGLTSHVDLPHQFGDGILVCSFGSGCSMRFSREVQQAPGEQVQKEYEEDYHLYLEDQSLLLLSGESRWLWKHGIDPREEDLVEWKDDDGSGVQRIRRGKRLSITIRWLLSHEERQRKDTFMQEGEQDMVARRV